MEGPTEPACIFFGVKVPAGQQVVIEPTLDQETFEVVHLTQVALGASPAKGPHVVFLKGSEEDDEEVAIGTLDRERCSQFSVDFSLGTSGVELSHSGASDVYVSGYRVVSLQPDQDGLDFSSEEESDEEGEEESDEDEDEEAPNGVPLAERKRRINGFLQGLAKTDKKGEQEGEDDSDDDEDDSDDDEDEDSDEDSDDDEDEDGKEAAIADAENDEQSDDDEDDEDSDDESDSDDSDDDESDDDDDESDSEDEEEAAAAAAAFGSKRAGAGRSTPAGKRRKLDPYAAAVAEVIAERGPQPLSVLGSAIKRPAGSPKLKSVIAAHPGIFKVDGAGNVDLQ